MTKGTIYILIAIGVLGAIMYFAMSKKETVIVNNGGGGSNSADECSKDWLCASMSVLGGASQAVGNLFGGFGNRNKQTDAKND